MQNLSALFTPCCSIWKPSHQLIFCLCFYDLASLIFCPMLSVPWMFSQRCYRVPKPHYINNLLLSNFPAAKSSKTIIFQLKVLETSFDYPTSKDLVPGLTASTLFSLFSTSLCSHKFTAAPEHLSVCITQHS